MRASRFKFKTEPFQHQRSMLRFHVCTAHSGEFSDFGTGKSKVALDLIRWRRERKEIEKAIILAPANVFPNWEVEIKTHTDLDYALGEIPRKVPPIVVLSYDGLKVKGGTKKKAIWKNERLVKVLALARKWRTQLICDESTKVKTPGASRTKAAIILSDNCTNRLLMTGVPIPNSLEDLWSQFRVMDARSVGLNFYRWRARYFYKRKWEYKWKPRENTLASIKGLVQTYGIRFEREDCLDLPETTYGVRWVELTAEQRRVIDLLSNDSTEFTWRNYPTMQIPNQAIRNMKKYEVAQGFLYFDKERKHVYQFPNNPKTALAKELCEDWIVGDTKGVIYTAFTQQKNDLYSELESYAPVDQMQPFQENPDHKLFIDHVSQGIGVTLHRANITIYTSNTFSLEDRIQSEARIRRIGQGKKQYYIDILAKDCPIEDRVYNCIRHKKDIHEEITKWDL